MQMWWFSCVGAAFSFLLVYTHTNVHTRMYTHECTHTNVHTRKADTPTYTQLFLLVGAKEFLPSNAVLQLLFGSVCTLHPDKCANVLSLLCGYNEENINSTRLGVFLSYTPAGMGVRVWLLLVVVLVLHVHVCCWECCVYQGYMCMEYCMCVRVLYT